MIRLGLSSGVRRNAAAVVLAGSAVGLLYGLASRVGIRVNASPSLPIGLYVVDSGSNSQLVEFCPSQPYAALANSRRYRDAGRCSDGGTPLLKPIVAREGDEVVVTAQGVSINGSQLPNSAARTRDTAGRPLTPWPFGTYRVQAGTMWVVSSYEARSFDSRYFGPIRQSQVLDHVRPLLVRR
jgi:conjugative transfer signal peptidase TraF